MFARLKLKNFKGFAEADIELRPVTLLAGLNSSGKSSILQAILLLKQISWQQSPSTDHIELYPNGRYVTLGSGRELFNEFADSDELRITCETTRGFTHDWQFLFNEHARTLVTRKTYNRGDLDELEYLRISYLSAERWGPRVTYPYESVEEDRGLGISGEYAIKYLIEHGDEPIGNIHLQHPDAKGRSLMHHVQAWLGEISPGVRLDVQPIRDAGISVAGFGFERRGDVASRYFRPTHVGFGLTYGLPLLVALLSASSGETILLENPEAHLHPRGHTQLARLIAAASKETQVIVETHSDHLMNGLRVAVRQKSLDPNKVVFHYCQRDGVATRIDTPELDSDGRLSFWPDGFFDEHERALSALVRPLKK